MFPRGGPQRQPLFTSFEQVASLDPFSFFLYFFIYYFRWTYPFVPDTDLLSRHGGSNTQGSHGGYKLRRRNLYHEEHLQIPRGVTEDSDSILGGGTTLGQGVVIRR